MKHDQVTRRRPYSDERSLPDDVRCHGYVADLICAVKSAAASVGQDVAFNKKNGSTYIVVRIPDVCELNKMDQLTDEIVDAHI